VFYVDLWFSFSECCSWLLLVGFMFGLLPGVRVGGHVVSVEEGEVTVGSALELTVEHARRRSIRSNHSATHLLHEALRQVLGDHIAQKGSMVAPERLRFDFSHTKAISDDELDRIEAIANRVVLQNDPVITRLMGVDEAKESGARALFGEKYGDEVRVVSMGVEVGSNTPYSIELCGGTHVSRTGDIGLISIVSESGVAAGTRRLEAMTGDAARRHLVAESKKLKELSGLLKVTPQDSVERLSAVIDERRKFERDLADARKKLAMGGGGSGAGTDVTEINGIKFMGRTVEGVEMKDLKGLADEAKAQLGSGIIALVNLGEDGKAGLVVAVTQDLTARFSAVDLVRIGSEALGGKGGGGRPDIAQAGGPDGAKAEEAIAAITSALQAIG
jgi:alanyl-tRNA synthetase